MKNRTLKNSNESDWTTAMKKKGLSVAVEEVVAMSARLEWHKA